MSVLLTGTAFQMKFSILNIAKFLVIFPLLSVTIYFSLFARCEKCGFLSKDSNTEMLAHETVLKCNVEITIPVTFI